MPIPDFNDDGQLPPGEHEANREEVRQRFATNYRRRQVCAGLEQVVTRLIGHGVDEIWIDGSFVTSKLRPSDVDMVYVPPAGVDIYSWGLLSPVPFQRDLLKRYHKVDL